MTCILIVRILVIPCGRPRNVRDAYVRIKLQKDTHHLWAERKTMFCLESDNELARHLLSLSIAPAVMARSSQLVPSISQSVQELPFLSSHPHNDVNI